MRIDEIKKGVETSFMQNNSYEYLISNFIESPHEINLVALVKSFK